MLLNEGFSAVGRPGQNQSVSGPRLAFAQRLDRHFQPREKPVHLIGEQAGKDGIQNRPSARVRLNQPIGTGDENATALHIIHPHALSRERPRVVNMPLALDVSHHEIGLAVSLAFAGSRMHARQAQLALHILLIPRKHGQRLRAHLEIAILPVQPPHIQALDNWHRIILARRGGRFFRCCFHDCRHVFRGLARMAVAGFSFLRH